MAILAAYDFLAMLGNVLSILYVALGLGLVIFFHEFGHFAVAKWCGVFVERFSIGFGPILWSFKKGETEYALSAIPFGGYVKMLGQDDMDPSQLSTEEIAQDPRSYSAKTVGQRMAIISAGVIMNVITGLLFFIIAFWQGVEEFPSILGHVGIGDPAWVSGLKAGDRIKRINGRDVTSFLDIRRGVALTSGDVSISGVHADGSPFEVTISPDTSGTRRMIGVGLPVSLKLLDLPDSNLPPFWRATPAARAEPAFLAGDVIHKVGDTRVDSFSQMQKLLAEHRAEQVDIYVQRKGTEKGELQKIVVQPNKFRTVGLWMEIGQIAAITKGSPAEEAGLKVGDKIVSIDDKEVGAEINPLEIPGFLADRHGRHIDFDVKRVVQGEGEILKEGLVVTPTDAPGWIERPSDPDTPISAPAIGIAYYVTPRVLSVVPGSPADGEIQPGERIVKVEFIRKKDDPPDGYEEDVLTVDLKIDEKKSEPKNWAYAFWLMQTTPMRTVRLHVAEGEKSGSVELTPEPTNEEWYLPSRGLQMTYLRNSVKADNVVEATQMGLAHTRGSITDIYLTLRSLFRGDLSVKELHGPVGIATVAYDVARNSFAHLLLFLGFLSVNLAVINFLPIPVLDGGHMVFLIWEGVTRKRPSERVLVAATYFGMAFVLGLMVLVLWLDLFVHRHVG